jgi:hypothetical protein
MSKRIKFAPPRFCPRAESLEAREVPAFLTSAPAYLTPTAPGVTVTPLVTVGDTVTDDYANGPAVAPYRMVGIPDGLERSSGLCGVL